MPRNDLWKSLLVAGAVLLSLWTLWPSFQFYQLPREERISAPKDTPTAKLREKSHNDTSERIFLRADQSLAYRVVMQVMNVMQDAGFLKVGLVAEEIEPAAS